MVENYSKADEKRKSNTYQKITLFLATGKR